MMSEQFFVHWDAVVMGRGGGLSDGAIAEFRR
jgi:hypothetical protein